jgi:type II secretory pathway pseudopilin PulG
VRSRLRQANREEGFTLVELLVASSMGVVVMGAVVLLVIGAVRGQPKITEQAEAVRTARWALERLTREIRNGSTVTKALPSEVSFQTYVRRATCGGTATPASATPAIKCQVTYACTTTACSRREAAPGVVGGTPKQIFSGIESSQVFTYAPAAPPITYVKITLRLPGPSGGDPLTVSSGASLRIATLGY